ncbi:MAG: DNA helicase [Gammaproteobacteria bacterium HGW-Gammaproteobacteria-1]|jgi:hypothetical protein|nr:MAG: DNA helicase [Gammaproteobacteria bacterium HGW-Gammaproteobacteria-1]
MVVNSKWASVVGDVGRNQYNKRLEVLRTNKIDTVEIERTISATVNALNYGDNESFVIFGEPQSGKTEMMIALNAKLLDEGCDVIINLLTDSVDLLQQSLARFRTAALSPSPKQFSELPSDPKTIRGKQWIIFAKKNARDLEKLIESLRFVDTVVIIDDEADYASPNSKINSKEKERTRINKLIHQLLNRRGQYIGVTATPARLDLNNTFDNNTERWVDFSPHASYVGQEFFFPQNGEINYRLHRFEADEGNERVELRNAVIHFLCGVAEQHQLGLEENFTMLVHTSGKTIEHGEDFAIVEETIGTLSDPNQKGYSQLEKVLIKISTIYNNKNPDSIVEFVLRNIRKNQIVEINSTRRNGVGDIAAPKSLFSFGVGGNIISRGVTFENLLSMYFTRTVKGKFSQDTYIQRARMFGNRSRYKESFQLWIPKSLMENWTKCFAFHQLAIEGARSGMGAPVWLSDHKSTPTALASIDRSSVEFENGEMSWGLFTFNKTADYMGETSLDDKMRLKHLREHLGPTCFPDYVYNFLLSQWKEDGDFCFHGPSIFGTDRSNYTAHEIASVRRTKGIFSTNEFKRGPRPDAKHHLKIFFNSHGKARLFYKINGKAISFIQNKK